MALKTINFFDGYTSGSAPEIKDVATASLVQYATDNDYELAETLQEGSIYFNTTDDVVRYYNGLAWITVASGTELFAHTNDSTIHFTQDTIDHTVMLNIGNYSHIQVDSHIEASTEVHGITGAVVGTTDTQTLSAKKFSDPITFTEQGSDPSSPGSGEHKVYPKADGRFYVKNSGGQEKLFGGGGGGDVDFLREVDGSEWLAYKDTAAAAPVDGTGGTPTIISVAQETATPLSTDDNDKTFVISKASGNGQGEGVGVEFSTRGEIDRAVGRIVKLYVKTSANYVDGDFRIYVADVTNGKIIETHQRDIYGSALPGFQIFQFQTAIDSDNYRLIFHCSSTNSNAYDLTVLARVTDSGYSLGSPITDFSIKGFTLTNFGNATSEIFGRRVGDSLHFKGQIVIGSTLPTGGLVFNLPSGLVMDTTKIPNNATNYIGKVAAQVGGSAYGGSLLRGATTTSFIFVGDSGTTQWNATVPVTWAAGNVIGFEAFVPILGWSSNVVMSETMPGRDVAFRARKTSNQTIPNGAYTKITFTEETFDPSNMYDTGTSIATIPESGKYLVHSRYAMSSGSSATTIYIAVYVNGVITNRTGLPIEGANALGTAQITEYYDLKKGDTVEVYSFQSNGDTADRTLSGSTSATTQTIFAISKINSGSQTIGLEETVLQKVSQQLPATLGAAGRLLRSNGTTGEWNSSIYVSANGNVGINSTDPQNRFEVLGNGLRSVARASTTSGDSVIEAQVSDYWSAPTYTGTAIIQHGSTAAGNHLTGVPYANLGRLEFQNCANAVIGSNGGIPIIFSIAGTERMRIDSSGNVTIATLAGTGSRAVNADASGTLSAASDSRLKQEVPEAPIPGLNEILQIQPKAYKWLSDVKKRGEKAATEIGFFADHVAPVIPSAAPLGNDGYYGFYDRSVTAALVKAVQELSAKNDEKDTIIQSLIARIEALEAR